MLISQNIMGINGERMKMLVRRMALAHQPRIVVTTNDPPWKACSSLHKKVPERAITEGMAGCQVSFTFFLIFLCIL